MRVGATLDSGIDFSPNELRGYVTWRIKSTIDIWPEVGSEIIEIDLEWHTVSLWLSQFFSKLLFLLVSAKLDLAHVLMLQFLLVRVVDFFLNFLDNVFVDLFGVLFVSVVVLDHHDTFSLVMPGGLCWLLLENLVGLFTSDKKGFLQSTVNHHDITLDSEKARIVLFLQILQWLVLLDFFFKLILHFVKVLFILVELFILQVLFQLNTLELVIHLGLLLNDLFGFDL